MTSSTCLLDAQPGEITIGEAYTWINASGPNLSQIIDSVRRPVEHNRIRQVHRIEEIGIE